jgi:type I restriction enzyme M protein
LATRPVFLSSEDGVKEILVEFNWFPGFAPSQKKKSIQSLHENFIEKNSHFKILEISSKSDLELGINLSAFNLSVNHNGEFISFESLFQGSKVFERGGPYTDIYFKDSREAKQDIRLKDSGEIIGFKYENKDWLNEPKTFFYDWMYINTVLNQSNLLDQIIHYDSFTDIEFNPKKSINCQAKAAALLVTLYKNGHLGKLTPEILLTYYQSTEPPKKKKMQDNNTEQISLSLFE